MHLRFGHTVIIDHAEGDAAKLWEIGGFIPQRRAAGAAKDPEPVPGVVFAQGSARVFHGQMRRLNQTPRGMRRAGEFSTMTAVAVSRTLDGAGDLVRDTAAEATGFHGNVSLAVGGPKRTVHPLLRACPFNRNGALLRSVGAASGNLSA